MWAIIKVTDDRYGENIECLGSYSSREECLSEWLRLRVETGRIYEVRIPDIKGQSP